METRKIICSTTTIEPPNARYRQKPRGGQMTMETWSAGRREWVGLAVLALPALLVTLDFSVLTLAVPKVTADLKPSGPEQLWIVDIYGFTLAGFLVTMGTLGDRVGRRRLLLIGSAAFGTASILAALSTNAATLIAARAVLGVAGATLLPSTLSLLRTMFRDDRQRSIAIAIWSTSLPIGGAIGPLVGGLLLEWFWWGAAFLLGVPIMVLLLIAGPLVLPEYCDPTARRADLVSVALSLAAILSSVYAMKELATGDVGSVSLVAVVVGVAAGVCFVVRQLRLEDPLIDVRLLRTPTFGASLGINLFSYFVILAALMLIAQYLQLVLGKSPLLAGLWTTPAMAGLIVGSLITPLLTRKHNPAAAMSIGLLAAAAGFTLLARAGSTLGLAIIVIASVIICLGLAPVTTLVVNMVLAAAPANKAGAASGLSETSTEFGGALGIAILGTIATTVYRSNIANRIPAGVPAASSAAAKSTLGGAVGVAGRLPDPTGARLLAAARDAFTHGVAVAAVVSVCIMLALAAVAATIGRRAATTAELRSLNENA